MQQARRDGDSATANALAKIRPLVRSFVRSFGRAFVRSCVRAFVRSCVRAACQQQFNAAACRSGRAREAGNRRRGSTNVAGFARQYRPAARRCSADHAATPLA
ncbi:hypothetical protein JM78_06540 [Burkholderia pyrrocinia]|nr:hypothetical protein JM78_06540 [Burkholderia pyrrocinia]